MEQGGSGALRASPGDGIAPLDGPRTGPARHRGRLRRSRRRLALRWLLAVSALLHLAILLAVVLSQREWTDARNVGAPADVDVVMLPPGAPEMPPTPVPEPNPTTPVPPDRGAKAPPVPAPPAAERLPSPPPPPAPEARPPPLPRPPPVPPRPEQDALLVPRPPPVPSRPVQPSPPFPHPIARSLAELGLSGQAPSTSGGAASQSARPQTGRGLDLSIGPVARASNGAVPRNPTASEPMVRVEGADLGEDWIRALHQWWDRHGYYPDQAAEQGEDGSTRVRLVVDRSGRVREAELEMRSGSQWLDLGSLAIFRNAQLPPFPPATPQAMATLHLTLNFILIRRGR